MTDLSDIQIETVNNIHYITKGIDTYWFMTGKNKLHKIEKYGTSAGVTAAWDTRGRGRKEESKSADNNKANNKTSSVKVRKLNDFETSRINIHLPAGIKVDGFVVHEHPSGVNIYAPEGQEHVIDEFNKTLENVPDKLKDATLSVIFAPGQDPSDELYSKKYGRTLVSNASAFESTGTIIKWGDGKGSPEPIELKTIVHEMGHLVDDELSTSKGWASAVAKDSKKGSDGYVSKYAKEAAEMYGSRGKMFVSSVNKEDFADSVKLFTIDKDNFKKNFPGRYAYLNKKIGD